LSGSGLRFTFFFSLSDTCLTLFFFLFCCSYAGTAVARVLDDAPLAGKAYEIIGIDTKTVRTSVLLLLS